MSKYLPSRIQKKSKCNELHSKKHYFDFEASSMLFSPFSSSFHLLLFIPMAISIPVISKPQKEFYPLKDIVPSHLRIALNMSNSIIKFDGSKLQKDSFVIPIISNFQNFTNT